MPRAEWALVLVALACTAAVVVLPGRAEAGRGQGRGRFGVLAPADDGAATPPGAGPAQSPSPSWKCRVCEDVVQTWHDRFKCAGSSLAMSPPNPFSPEAESKPFQSCRQPKLDCNDLNAKLQPVCKAMRYQFITRTEKVIWSSIMNKGNVYDTCIELGKCVNDTEQTDAKECRDAFKQPSCKEHLTCAPVQQKCSSRCFLCYHLVRDWPLFQQTCKPEGAKVEAEAFLDEEKVQLSNGPKPDADASGKLPGGGGRGKSSFLQTFMRNHQKKGFFARNTRRHRARDKAAEDRAWNDRVAGPFAAPPQRATHSDYFDEDLLTFLETELRAVPPRGGGGGDGGSAYDALDDQQQEEEQRLVEQYRHALLSVAEQQRVAMEQRQQNAAALWAGERADAGMGVGMGADMGAVEAADDQAPKIPITNSDTLPLKCHDMWDSIRYSKKARYFVQWKEEVSILTTGRDRMDPAGLWDANVVCKCLGHCELSKFEYMGLESVCKYGPPEQRSMDMALGEYIRDKPHSAVSPKDGDDNLADGAADD